MSECKHQRTTGREEERGEGRSIIAAEWAPPAGKGNNQHCRGKAEIRRAKKDWSQRERDREVNNNLHFQRREREVDVAATDRRRRRKPTLGGRQRADRDSAATDRDRPRRGGAIIYLRNHHPSVRPSIAPKAPRQNKSKCDPRRRPSQADSLSQSQLLTRFMLAEEGPVPVSSCDDIHLL